MPLIKVGTGNGAVHFGTLDKESPTGYRGICHPPGGVPGEPVRLLRQQALQPVTCSRCKVSTQGRAKPAARQLVRDNRAGAIYRTFRQNNDGGYRG